MSVLKIVFQNWTKVEGVAPYSAALECRIVDPYFIREGKYLCMPYIHSDPTILYTVLDDKCFLELTKFCRLKIYYVYFISVFMKQCYNTTVDGL